MTNFVDSSMEARTHCLMLGQIIANLQSLELRLRSYLYMNQVKQDSSKKGPEGWDVFFLKKGASVIENAFSNYDSLDELITKYNNLVASDEEQVDQTITDIRDLLAHGRTVSPIAALDLRIFKFSRATNGRVTVTHAEDMTPEWLNQKNQQVLAAMRKVQGPLNRQMGVPGTLLTSEAGS